jgi:hypothetical protein
MRDRTDGQSDRWLLIAIEIFNFFGGCALVYLALRRP